MGKIYQILEYTINGIELYLETTDKDYAVEQFNDFEGTGEAHLVEVLRINQREGYYLKDGKNGGKYVHLNG